MALPPLDLGRLRGISKLWRRTTPLMSTRAVDENLAPLETPYLRDAVGVGLRAVGAGGYEAPPPEEPSGCGGGCIGGIVGGMSGCVFGVLGGGYWYTQRRNGAVPRASPAV